MTKLKIFLLYFMLIGIFLPVQVVLADIGPKPSMEFEFEQNLADVQVTITSVIMYECDQPDCTDAAALEELGPQGIRCEELRCSAIAYGFAPYHKLEIQFSDGKTRESNIFETGGFDSVYLVTVGPEDMVVELTSATEAPPDESFPPQSNGNGFPQIGGIALLCVCVVVVGVALIGLIIFAVRRTAKK